MGTRATDWPSPLAEVGVGGVGVVCDGDDEGGDGGAPCFLFKVMR